MKRDLSSLEIAKQLVAIDTSKKSGIRKAMKWLTDWCDQEKLFIRQFPGTQAILIETKPNLLVHFNFVIHIDVVPADGWSDAFQPTEKDDFLFGRGAVDDKGPLAICLDVLRTSKKNDELNISCLIVTDEEVENVEIGKILASGSFTPNFSIVVDGGTHSIIDYGQKGIIRVEVEILTAGGHSAFEEKDKSSSIQLLELIEELKSFGKTLKHDKEFSPAFINISSFISDTVPYGLPNKAIAHLEIQFPSPQTSTIWMTKIAELEKEWVHCSFHMSWVSEPHLLKDKTILKILSSFREIKCVTTGGNNLAKDLCLVGIPAISHCPVEEYIAHSNDERIKLSDFEKGKDFYLKLINAFVSLSFS